MNKIYSTFLLFFLLIFSCSSAFSETSFAILPTEHEDAKGNKEVFQDRSIVDNLYKILMDSGRYKIVDRSRIEHILEEHDFQVSDWVDPSKVVKVGRIIGVDKFIISRIKSKPKDREFIFEIKVIDAKTGQVEFSRKKTIERDAYKKARSWCVEIIEKYPLLGKILGKSGDVFVVNLGKRHNLKIGDRLFVAHADDSYRLGTLEVVDLNRNRALTKVKSMKDPKFKLGKNNLISSDPIPKKELFVSKKSLLPNIIKGKLILEDNMEKNKYLYPINNETKRYVKGRLHLKGSSAICFYPPPFDKLDNFILEGEMEFHKGDMHLPNYFEIIFRAKGEYPYRQYYTFAFSNIYVGISLGGVKLSNKCFEMDSATIGRYRFSKEFEIDEVDFENSIEDFNTGELKNFFRIVAYGSKFDCYLNDKLIFGFEDEFLDKGSIGFSVYTDGNASIDNVKIWEAVQQ